MRLLQSTHTGRWSSVCCIVERRSTLVQKPEKQMCGSHCGLLSMEVDDRTNFGLSFRRTKERDSLMARLVRRRLVHKAVVIDGRKEFFLRAKRQRCKADIPAGLQQKTTPRGRCAVVWRRLRRVMEEIRRGPVAGVQSSAGNR